MFYNLKEQPLTPESVPVPITLWLTSARTLFHIQSNLNGSNTDDSFTMANSNSFLSPYEILPIAQENKEIYLFHHEIVG